MTAAPDPVRPARPVRLRPRPRRPRAARSAAPRSGSCARRAGRCPSTGRCAPGTAMLAGLPGPRPGHRDHPAAGPPARRRRGDPLLRHRAAAGGGRGRHRDQARASGRWSPPRCARWPTSTRCRRSSPSGSTSWRPPSGRLVAELGADAADRLRRRAVHARHLPDRGRPLEGARPHQGVHVRRARGLVAAARAGWRCPRPTFLRVQIDAGASAVQLFDSWAGVLSAADYAERVLPHSRAVFDGARRPATCRASTSASAPASCCR